MRNCEICGKEHDGSFGRGRFCSSGCARRVGGMARTRKLQEKNDANRRAAALGLGMEMQGRGTQAPPILQGAPHFTSEAGTQSFPNIPGRQDTDQYATLPRLHLLGESTVNDPEPDLNAAMPEPNTNRGEPETRSPSQASRSCRLMSIDFLTRQ